MCGEEDGKANDVPEAEEIEESKNKETKEVGRVRGLIREMVKNKTGNGNLDFEKLEGFFNSLSEDFMLTQKMLEDIKVVFKNKKDE